MADKGLVSKSTLQGFADEIRRIAESEQTGTPAEMLALLQTVEAGGGAEVVYGTVKTPSGWMEYRLECGVVFPQTKNYMLAVGLIGVPTYGRIVTASIIVKDGVVVGGYYGSTPSSETKISRLYRTTTQLRISDFATGEITSSYKFQGNVDYDYVYIGWDD